MALDSLAGALCDLYEFEAFPGRDGSAVADLRRGVVLSERGLVTRWREREDNGRGLGLRRRRRCLGRVRGTLYASSTPVCVCVSGLAGGVRSRRTSPGSRLAFRVLWSVILRSTCTLTV